MSYSFRALTPKREEIDALHVSGDMSNFFEYFHATEMDTGTNGDGEFTVSVEGIQNFLKTENNYPHPLSGESLLREFLANVINHTPVTQLIIEVK